jgi:predicted metal-dependent peptidase
MTAATATKPKGKAYTLPEARLRCTKALPYLTQHVMSLHCVPRPGLGTFAVDKYMRMYYDPACLEEWTLDECAGVILHEDCHVVLGHHKRLERVAGKKPTNHEVRVWNIAADAVVNSMLRDCRDRNGGAAVKLPPDCVFPERLPPDCNGIKLPVNKTVEEYYFLLIDKVQKNQHSDKPYGEGDELMVEVDENGNVTITDQDGKQVKGRLGGSGADGVPKPWEEPKPEDGGKTPATSDFEQEMLARQVAQRIDEHRQKHRGTVPGSWQRFAGQTLRPKTPWWRQLETQVKYAVNCGQGFGDHTWRRLNRRVPRGCGPLPAHIKPIPRVSVIADTSGSMDTSDLQKAMGVIADVLKRLPSRDGVRIIAGDTHAQFSKKLFRADAVELLGGGGTDMGALIVEAAKDRPDVIVCVTDGYTPWPSEPVAPKVVICVTREHDDYPIPAWMIKVVIKNDEESED